MTIDLTIRNVAIVLCVLGALMPLLMNARAILGGIAYCFRIWLYQITSDDWPIHASVTGGILAFWTIHPIVHEHLMDFSCPGTFLDVIIGIITLGYIILIIWCGHDEKQREKQREKRNLPGGPLQ